MRPNDHDNKNRAFEAVRGCALSASTADAGRSMLRKDVG
jgi:hypothetical protein